MRKFGYARQKVVELFHLSRRVSTHVRSAEAYRHTTAATHRPADHQAWAEADHGKLQSWAASVGPATGQLMQRILSRSPFPEQAWRSGRGLKRVGMKYPERIEVAAERALRLGATSYKPVDRMLRLRLDLQPLPGDEHPPDAKTPDHANVRGPSYYN